MKNKKLIIAAAAGLAVGIVIGAAAVAPVAFHQYKKKGEALFLLDALVGFIDKSPECREAVEKL